MLPAHSLLYLFCLSINLTFTLTISVKWVHCEILSSYSFVMCECVLFSSSFPFLLCTLMFTNRAKIMTHSLSAQRNIDSQEVTDKKKNIFLLSYKIVLHLLSWRRYKSILFTDSNHCSIDSYFLSLFLFLSFFFFCLLLLFSLFRRLNALDKYSMKLTVTMNTRKREDDTCFTWLDQGWTVLIALKWHNWCEIYRANSSHSILSSFHSFPV